MTDQTPTFNSTEPVQTSPAYKEVNQLSEIIKAEIDIQISTAKTYPRNLTEFKRKALSMATLDEDTAGSCFYVLPRGGKNIEGPSIRLAEIIINSWGNIRAAANVIANDRKTITARAYCHDLETNTAIAIEVKRKITDKTGKTFSEDMQVVTGNAACKIALRNAVFSIIPMVYTKNIYEQCRKIAAGSKETLTARRDKLIYFFNEMQISKERIFSALEVKGLDDIDQEKFLTLLGIYNAIRDGDSTPEETFPQIVKKTDSQVKSESALKNTLDQINEKKTNGNGHKTEPVKELSPELKKIEDGVVYYQARVKEAKEKNNTKLEKEMQSKLDEKKTQFNKLAETEGVTKL